MLFEPLPGGHWDHRDAHDQRKADCRHQGQCDVAEELSCLLLNQQDGGEDHHRGEGGSEHRTADFEDAISRGDPWFLSLLEMAEDVFDHHDRVVHDHADREGKPGERDDIDRPTEHHQDAEGRDGGNRNGDRDDAHGAQTAKEEEQGDGGEDASQNQIRAHQFEGILHVGGGVVGLDEFQGTIHSKLPGFLIQQGSRFVQLGDLGLKHLHRLQQIRPSLELKIEEGTALTTRAHPGGRFLPVVADLRHITEVDRASLVAEDDHLSSRLRSIKTSGGSDSEVPLSLFYLATGEVGVRRGDAFPEAGKGDPALGQSRGVDDDLQLGCGGSTHSHLADARDALEAGFHTPIHEVIEQAGIELRIR